MRDVDGRVQKIRVDVSYVAELLKYLDTTPGGVPAPQRPTHSLVGGELVGTHDEDPEVD
jgi:hypothetical protein